MNKQVHICVPRTTTPPRPVLEASYGTVRTGVRFRNEKLVSQCSDIAQIESLRTGMKMPDCCAMHSRTFYSYAVIRLGFYHLRSWKELSVGRHFYFVISSKFFSIRYSPSKKANDRIRDIYTNPRKLKMDSGNKASTKEAKKTNNKKNLKTEPEVDVLSGKPGIDSKPTPVKPFPETGKENNNDSDTLDSELGTGSESESESMSDERATD
ncbi:hypothetical protein U1Q18_051487 [Sarracenia purpurea var. burkii]